MRINLCGTVIQHIWNLLDFNVVIFLLYTVFSFYMYVLTAGMESMRLHEGDTPLLVRSIQGGFRRYAVR